jgi:hypothetical protein
MYVFRGVPSRTPDYDLIVLLVPFEHGAGPYAELLANLSRDRDLPLSSYL